MPLPEYIKTDRKLGFSDRLELMGSDKPTGFQDLLNMVSHNSRTREEARRIFDQESCTKRGTEGTGQFLDLLGEKPAKTYDRFRQARNKFDEARREECHKYARKENVYASIITTAKRLGHEHAKMQKLQDVLQSLEAANKEGKDKPSAEVSVGSSHVREYLDNGKTKITKIEGRPVQFYRPSAQEVEEMMHFEGKDKGGNPERKLKQLSTGEKDRKGMVIRRDITHKDVAGPHNIVLDYLKDKDLGHASTFTRMHKHLHGLSPGDSPFVESHEASNQHMDDVQPDAGVHTGDASLVPVQEDSDDNSTDETEAEVRAALKKYVTINPLGKLQLIKGMGPDFKQLVGNNFKDLTGTTGDEKLEDAVQNAIANVRASDEKSESESV